MVGKVVTELVVGQITAGTAESFGFQTEGDGKHRRILHRGMIWSDVHF